MDRRILQIGLITAYGNAHFKNTNVSIEKNHPTANIFLNTNFYTEKKSTKIDFQKEIAADPNDWFEYLLKKKIKRLHLHYYPANTDIQDHISIAFVGGGSYWGIITEFENHADIWLSKTNKKTGDSEYHQIKTENKDIIPKKTPSLETTKLYLKEILSDLITFTERNELENWKKVFSKAKNNLSKENKVELVNENLLPEEYYVLDVLQIISCIDQAWVFGGMGSWNDVVNVDDYDLYTRLTANLYDTLCKAFTAAINSSK